MGQSETDRRILYTCGTQNRKESFMGILIKAPTRRRDTGIPVVVPPASVDARGALHIREVVRITGLRREQLYMWQRRYGFPDPSRDGFGDRVYPPDQVARLKLIKQLLSEGWRAGAVVPLAMRDRSCLRHLRTIPISSASRSSSSCSSPRASTASRSARECRHRKSVAPRARTGSVSPSCYSTGASQARLQDRRYARCVVNCPRSYR